MLPRLHRASVVGRARADVGLLALILLVVAFATALTSAVAPLTERTSDRAMAASIRNAGTQGNVIATTSNQGDDGQRIRDPRAATELRYAATSAQRQMRARLAAVVRPGLTTLTTPPLHLLDAGPGRYLRLSYVTGAGPAPATTYLSGGPPKPSVPAAQAHKTVTVQKDPWPVQIALPKQTADALGLKAGDRIPAEDEQHVTVTIVVSGVFTARDSGDDVWAAVPTLLHPIVAKADGVTTTSGAAIASDDSLPDLRLGVPSNDLTSRIAFSPRPSRVTWSGSDKLAQSVVALKASPTRASGGPSWDSLLDRVLTDGRAKVSAAQGQASVLIIGLLAGALLVLVLAGDLLVRRRAGSLALMRERGASLAGIASELLVEAVVVALLGTGVGLLVTLILIGDVGWGWCVPVLVVASLAAPILGTVAAARAADVRRVPANRSTRRVAARIRHARRLTVEGVVLAVAVLSYVALRQRGVVGSVDLTASSALTWWAVAGGLVVVRFLPPVVRLVLTRARRATGAVPLVAAARMSSTAVRALPLLVVAVTVAQLTVGIALAATEQHGQAAGALLSVGGDARLQTAPDRSVVALAHKAAKAPGVRAAVAARVTDGVQASSAAAAAEVRLVVVDSAAYQRLLATSDLVDAPQLARLRRSAGGQVPALLRGGDPGLRHNLQLRWQDAPVNLRVVGTAPPVDDSTAPVVIVDAAAFTAKGPVADPGTVWAVGPGAAAALHSVAGKTGSVDVLADVLHDRRSAPLAAGLVHLALASSLLLVLFAVLGVALAAAAEAPPRAESLGRLRSLGLGRFDVRRVLIGELITPVLVGSLAGLALGIGAALTMFGPLSLELVTGQSSAPDLVVPWWTVLAVIGLIVSVLVIAVNEAGRIGRTPLAALLRGGDRR
ncbi:MAG: putative transport system permease protein [Nocardioidaceae bacterium]|nr:putative transport system permease protein [Nocardioidaceae bacterium]